MPRSPYIDRKPTAQIAGRAFWEFFDALPPTEREFINNAINGPDLKARWQLVLERRAGRRYYAECTEVRRMFMCHHATAWQVFDRLISENDGSGDSLAVALARNRHAAFRIRDALNALEAMEEDARNVC